MSDRKYRSISEEILDHFRTRQDYTVAELLALVKKRRPCSQRGIYKEMKNLINAGKIIRNGSRYSLSLTWVLAQLRNAEEMYATLVDDRLTRSILPTPGGKKRWRFDDLQHLDRFWIQMIFLLFEESKSRQMFVWVPYFWFDIIHYAKDQEAQEAMLRAGNRMHMMIGDESYLSRLPTRYWSKAAYNWSYAPGPFCELMHLYYDVIDGYVMTIELTQKTTAQIAALFRSIKGPADLYKIRQFDLIKSSGRSTLTIEHNERKAELLMKKFRSYFGVRL